MPIKHNYKKHLTIITTLLARSILPVAALVILAGAGHLACKRQSSRPPPQSTTTVPLPSTDWRGVDKAVVAALTAAHRAAEAAATAKLDTWNRCLMERVDSFFLPWYFGYWTQQTLGLKSAWFWAAHEVGMSQSTSPECITHEIQEQFARRVMRPEVAQLELERIANETLQVYINELGPRLSAIPDRYQIPQADWERYLSEIAVMTTRTDGNRQVSLTLKTLTASTAVGSLLLAKTIAPQLEAAAARVSSGMAGNAAGEFAARTGGKAAAKASGEMMGEIVGIVIIAWDLADHYRTKHTEMPVLRRNIADYLDQVKHRLLHDPQNGIITILDGMEASIAASQRSRTIRP
jgi:hypothetical protein